jgi:hypothetical protein
MKWTFEVALGPMNSGHSTRALKRGVAAPRQSAAVCGTLGRMRRFAETPLRKVGSWQTHCAQALAWVVIALAVHAASPEPSLVLTQIPVSASTKGAGENVLDVRYPPGSRVVLAAAPYSPGKMVVLSRNLLSAGDASVSWDGRRVYFAGKARVSGTWQIYEAGPSGGTPKALTDMPGGAMDAGLLANGELVFISPVPKNGAEAKPLEPSAVYAKPVNGPARRLTFGAANATDLTLLADGRILFVSALPDLGPTPHQALFTVNNDGTEFSLYAGRHESLLFLHRPREAGKRIAYLAAEPGGTPGGAWAETVWTARPFTSQERVLRGETGACRSVEDGGDGSLLVCLEKPGRAGPVARNAFAVFRVSTNAVSRGEALFEDPSWDTIEAAPLVARVKPLGHISAMVPAKKTGTVICLDANYSSYGPTNADAPRAASVRVTAQVKDGQIKTLGDVAVQPDGSFMADVPVDVPLGFETLDADGKILRRTPLVVWVRAGENRSCIGCHEPHGRSPRNHRPLAPRFPTPCLTETTAKTTQPLVAR